MKTTTLLHDLCRNCIQGERAYRAAYEQAADSDLKYLFSSYSRQRAHFARQLREALADLGMPPLARNVRGIQPRPAGRRSSRAILNDCARSDKVLILRYRRALGRRDLSANLRELLERQQGEVEAACDRIHQLHGLAQPT